MPSANGQLTALRYVSESAFGVPSGTVYKALRFTDVGLQLQKGTFQSNEIRSDRLTADLRHGMRSVGGDVPVELSLTTFDDLLEAALSGTWAAVTSGSISLATTAGTNTITRTVGSFVTDGFLPGDEVLLSGFTTGGNNARTKLVTVAALTVTVELALITEVAAAGKTVAMVGKRVKTGTSMKSFHIERAFNDVNQFQLFKGCVVDALKLSIKPEAIIEATFSFIGKDMAASGVTTSTAVTAAATNSPMDAFRGLIRENNSTVAVVTGLDIDLANGRSVKGVIGQTTPQEVFEGGCTVTGTVTLFFSDGTMVAKFAGETESSIDVRLDDPNGVDFLRIRIPRVKYTGADVDNPKEGPISVTMPFVGLADSVSGCAMLIQRSNV